MINKAILIGHLGKNPELRTTNSGKQVCTFPLATNNGYGEKQTTDWHNVVCFDKTAETVAKYLDKGSLVYVEGRIQYDKYVKDGENRVSTRIIASSVNFFPKGENKPKEHALSNNIEKAVVENFDGAAFDDIPF